MNQKDFNIIPIGVIDGEKQTIQINPKFNKGLKHLSMFSHALIIYKNDITPNILNTQLSQKVVELKQVDEKKGQLTVVNISELNDTNSLYDIKPYFPNEDRVKDALMPVHSNDSPTTLVTKPLSQMGVIRKIKGSYYLEIAENFDEYIEALKGYSHIKVIWWFHKFEKDIYKRTLECEPPYENAPKTGIFASRSPVRPTPIAMTTARILEIDSSGKRIKVSLLDCFDNTPLLGISPYIPNLDYISDYHLPTWVEHWSEYLDDRDFDTFDLPILLQPAQNILRGKSIATNNDGIETDYFTTRKDLPVISNDGIQIKGARQHNLKNIDVTIPYNKITVMTGVSGSGKSSLAFDTIYAESQQRFFSNMSLSERSRMAIMEKPNFDLLSGLPPAIAISQNYLNRNPRSTVGTLTDIYSLLRTLFANIGIRHCPECGRAVVKMTIEEIIECLMTCTTDTKLTICPFNQKTLKKDILPSIRNELKDVVCEYLTKGLGAIQVQLNDNQELIFQTTEKCYYCDHILFEMTTSDFSFNNPESMCPVCNGLGEVTDIDANLIIRYPEKSILDGASEFWSSLRKFQKAPNANWMKGEILALANDMQVDLEKPWCDLPEAFKTQAIYGSGKRVVSLTYKNKNGRTGTITRPAEGAYNILKRLLKSITLETQLSQAEQFMTTKPCEACLGERLKMESRIVTIHDKRFPEVVNMTIGEFKNWITTLPNHLSLSEKKLVQPLLQVIYTKLTDYIEIGLDYLTLDRAIPTLSGGELQRLYTITQLNSGLSNILYILDEPTTGLHPKDYEKLMNIIYRLKQQNNTIIIVEHSLTIMKHADYIIDIGPGAGIYGGHLVAQGTPSQIMKNKESETGQYLSGHKKLSIKNKVDSKGFDSWIHLNGVNGHNLQNIDIKFPLNALTCITGVSGSGKSSLVHCGILPAIAQSSQSKKQYKEISGAKEISKVVHITQKPIGRSTRSTPATYTGMMDEIRSLFTKTPQAIKLKYAGSKFSYNSKEGQCPSCHGLGYKTLDTAFTASTKVECPLCKGQKFHPTTLQVYYKDKNIAQVLDMSVSEALVFFEDNKKLKLILDMLSDIGLSYLTLGQNSQTLSGGEAQRIKLATELIVNNANNILYLLDEPTTGLHFSDIQNLLHILSKITKDNTVILVEHNLDVISNADWIIDLGPGGGSHGGMLMAQGRPTDIIKCVDSHTGKLLKSLS